MIPRENLAVVARRHEPADSLDFFPTPPWATRALMATLHFEAMHYQGLRYLPRMQSVLDPCCGEGHMAGVLDEFYSRTVAMDVHDYGFGGTRDFLDTSKPDLEPFDWLIFNPPFGQLSAFVDRAMQIATVGVAVLCRTQALEGVGRYRGLWSVRAPDLILPFVERVPMHKGRWVVNGSTATGYMWLVWDVNAHNGSSITRWIAPGSKKRFSHDNDPVRFNGVYRKRTLISAPGEKRKWREDFYTPAQWANLRKAA